MADVYSGRGWTEGEWLMCIVEGVGLRGSG